MLRHVFVIHEHEDLLIIADPIRVRILLFPDNVSATTK